MQDRSSRHFSMDENRAVGEKGQMKGKFENKNWQDFSHSLFMQLIFLYDLLACYQINGPLPSFFSLPSQEVKN